MSGFDVVVVGSINRDVGVRAPRLPVPGETVIGSEHFFGPGGKGANQAVAAARLGASVAMVGRVGADDSGEVMVSDLEKEGVDVSAITIDDGAGTGLAVITIDDTAENTIVVSPGANMTLTPSEIEANRQLIARAKVVLTQLEVPIETVEAAALVAEGIFCLNPAPARRLSAQLIDAVDVLTPNRTELAALSATEIGDYEEVVAGALRLNPRGATVVTLGAEGAALVDGDRALTVPPYEVDPVDPTGAGDAFCAGLGVALGGGMETVDAVRFAAACGALATTGQGAREGLKDRSQVEALLNG